jgi:hypothetical protein
MAWRHSVQEQEQYSSTHRLRLSWLFVHGPGAPVKVRSDNPYEIFS